MNRYKVIIGCLLVLAGVIVVLTLIPAKPKVSVSEETETAGEARTESVTPAQTMNPKTVAKERASGLRNKQSAGSAEEREQPGAKADAAASSEKKAAAAHEQAVAAWEALVDQLIEQKNLSAAEQAPRVKETFDKLDKAEQMDGIHRALNLFPDEQFPALYGILFDKTEDPEVLDAIFSDALNRPEEIKNPLMKELRKDREHPMFFESARILDVVEPKVESP